MMPPATPPAPGRPWPRVTVIILNYNGWRFMPACLAALAATDYPAEALDILVVDNASHDGSVEHVRREFPGVRLLALGENTGFAGGNNAGIRASDAPYVVMLNNDTAVEPGWLKPLVAAAEADPKVGACGSKLLFFHARLPLGLTVESSFVPAETLGGGDTRVLGVRLREAALAEPSIGAQVGYGAGWYDREGSGDGAYRWSAAEAELIVPVAEPGAALSLRLEFAGGPPAPLPPATVRLAVGGVELAAVEVGAEPVALEVAIPAELSAQAQRYIQNAGQELLPGGYCRDRGSYVEQGRERHSPDGAYERQEEVFGLCGAAMLMRRAMLDEIGLLDDRFFMYYEDVDLCWRARSAGWRMLYVPESVVRHIHSGSSGEWSPLFRFHVERNRLLMLIKNAPRGLALRAVGDYAAESGRWVWRSLRALRQGRRSAAASWAFARNNARVLASMLRATPALLRQRRRIRRRADDAAILRWMVE